MEIGALLSEATGSPWSLFCGLVVLLFLLWAANGLESFILRPWRLEGALRAQGLHGRSYRFPAGDLAENAPSRPVPLSRAHDISARVAPLLYNSIKEFGKVSISWFGARPRVIIADAEMVKEVLSYKPDRLVKPKFGKLGKLLADGLATIEGEKWAKHRKIINPAFHVEKLKRMLPVFSTSCMELVNRWENSMGPDGSYELDICPELQTLTRDVISRTAFGSSYLEGKRIFQLQGEQSLLVLAAWQKTYIPGYFLACETVRSTRHVVEIPCSIL